MTKLISKYQRGGKANKDDKKGNKKEQPKQQEQEVIQGNAIPSWYRPPVVDADEMGGLGAGVANQQRMKNEQIAREEAARREYQKYQAYLNSVNQTPYHTSYDQWVRKGKPGPLPKPRQAEFRQSNDTRTPQQIENDNKMRQYRQQMDEQAAITGHALGAPADLNVAQFNANTMAGANVFMGVTNPITLGAMYTSADLAQGDYGAAAFGAGLTFIPGTRQFVRGMRPAVQETKQAVRQTVNNIGQRVNTAREAAMSAAFEPVRQPVPIAVGSYGGYANLPGNYSQMFSFHPIKGIKAGWKALRGEAEQAAGAAESAKPKATRPSTDDYTLGDIRYQKPFSRRRQKVTVTDPTEIETHTLNGEPISAEPKRTTVRTVNIKGQDYYNPQLTEVPTEAKAARTYYRDAAGNEYNNAFAVKGKKGKYYVNGPDGQRISVTQISEPGRPAGVKYQYNGVDVQPFNAQVYEHNGQYYPLSAYRRGTTTRTVNQGEVIPEDATWKAGKSEGNVEGQRFRTPRSVAKHGPDSWVDATGEPLPWYNNPGFYHRGAMGVTAASLLFGAPNVYKAVKWLINKATSENGLVGGAVEEANSKNNQGASTPDSNAIKMDERRIDSLQNDLNQKRQDTNNYNPAGFRRNQ